MYADLSNATNFSHSVMLKIPSLIFFYCNFFLYSSDYILTSWPPMCVYMNHNFLYDLTYLFNLIEICLNVGVNKHIAMMHDPNTLCPQLWEIVDSFLH